MNSGMMLKLSNLLRSRSQVFPRRSFDKAVREYFSLHSLVFQAGISTGPNTATDGKFAGRVFASYSVYKGKASVSASPRLPTFSKLDCGSLRVDRQGVIMLTFRPAIGERKYDWEKRQLFALSPTEVGSLLSLGAKDSCEFFHDPSMLSSNAGQVRKTLSVKAHADGSGYFFSLNVVNNLLKTTERLTVPVTTAEFAVMRAAFSYALPHIMGWDRCTNQLPNTTGDSPTKVNPQARHLEWER